jgi:hypothetical protein
MENHYVQVKGDAYVILREIWKATKHAQTHTTRGQMRQNPVVLEISERTHDQPVHQLKRNGVLDPHPRQAGVLMFTPMGAQYCLQEFQKPAV